MHDFSKSLSVCSGMNAGAMVGNLIAGVTSDSNGGSAHSLLGSISIAIAITIAKGREGKRTAFDV